jgi:hypothetical protein
VCVCVCVHGVKKRERKIESTNKVAYLNGDFTGLPEWLEVAVVDEKKISFF